MDCIHHLCTCVILCGVEESITCELYPPLVYMCHSVCGVEEPIACGLYPPLVYMCHSVCGVEESIACGLYPPLVCMHVSFSVWLVLRVAYHFM